MIVWLFFFFFFKQKTAYEMRISDWSSDVCSSDLIEACEAAIRRHLDRLDGGDGGDGGEAAPLPAPRKPKGHSKNGLSFEARPLLYRLTGVDRTEINGMSESTVLAVLSETGTDMSAWPSEKHFASWLALSPGTKVSGGKRLRGRTKVYAHRAAAPL